MVGRDPKNPPPEDRVTFLPIDRSRAAEKFYAPWDARAKAPSGGMRLGEPVAWVAERVEAPVDAAGIGRACDAVVEGKGSYAALMYLSRLRVEDLSALLEATVSSEVRVRWERLWVLSPFVARLCRQPEGVTALVPLLLDDLGAVHLLSKFSEQNNPAVKRLFARLHDPLLAGLLLALFDSRADPRRANLISTIISSVESLEEPLNSLMPAHLTPAQRGSVLDLLYLRPPPRRHKTLQSRVLRERLMQLRR